MTADFRLLGDVEVRVDGHAVDLGHRRQQSVLVTLLVEANRMVSTDQLVDRVWADRSTTRTRDTLYGYLHRLRKVLADIDDVDLVRQPGGYLIAVHENLIDLHRFREAVRQARTADNSSVALKLFDEGLSLWRGEAFSGMDTPWLNGIRDNLAKERFAAELDHTDLRLTLGQHTELVPELTTRSADHPWDERLAAQLMLALYRSGRQAEALTHYEQTRARLTEDLGLDPTPALQQVHQQILTADPTLTPRRPGPRVSISDNPLDLAARELATAVNRQWTAEAEMRSLRRPAPVHVRWSTSGRPVRPHQDTLRGDLTDVATKFRALPTRQLVVLGEPGAGKSVLAILLTLGLLDEAVPGQPTPVLLSLSSWNPHDDHLHTWLARTLLAEYPGLGNKRTYGPDAAIRLVTEGRVIPILDGLDETPPALHAAAIDALDQAIAGGRPLVVTCRSNEYETAVRNSGSILAAAAVVELEPVDIEDAITYLTARHHLGDVRWKPVIDHLHDHPDGPLAETLATPLMVDLTRTAYLRPTKNPAELLNPARFPDRATIEDHLLDEFLPATYPNRPQPPTPKPQAREPYRAHQARRWLTFLANHLRAQQTRDFAWWRLFQALPGTTRGLLFGLVPGVLFASTALVVGGPVMALVCGTSTALAGYVAQGWGTRVGPLRVERRFRGTTRRFLVRFAAGVVISLGIGAAWTLPAGAVVVLALVFGFGMGLHMWLDTPTEASRASSPLTVQIQDRTSTLAYALSVGVSIGLFYAFTVSISAPATGVHTVAEIFHVDRAIPAALVSALFGWFAFKRVGGISYGLAGFVVGGQVMPHHISPAVGVAVGTLFGTAIGLSAALSRSWGAFVLTRTWLAVRGRIPLRLNRFLEDAHRRGVLRQTGATYQFRHARLQDRLTRVG